MIMSFKPKPLPKGSVQGKDGNLPSDDGKPNTLITGGVQYVTAYYFWQHLFFKRVP